MDKEIRWHQRYENFDKVYTQFHAAILDFFDVVHYESLKHSGLKEHIDKFGKIFYFIKIRY